MSFESDVCTHRKMCLHIQYKLGWVKMFSKLKLCCEVPRPLLGIIRDYLWN